MCGALRSAASPSPPRHRPSHLIDVLAVCMQEGATEETTRPGRLTEGQQVLEGGRCEGDGGGVVEGGDDTIDDREAAVGQDWGVEARGCGG